MHLFAGNVIVSMLIMGYYVCLLLSIKDAICKVGGVKNVPMSSKRILQYVKNAHAKVREAARKAQEESERLQKLKRKCEDEEQVIAEDEILEMEKQ